MQSREYVTQFKKAGFGLFVHFGLYSALGEGEWAYYFNEVPDDEYHRLFENFSVSENFAKELVGYAKKAGCKYITLTTRHHDGFSLFDTKGLSDYDVMHTPTKRDIVKEFADECHKEGIQPFFYHTLMDWKVPCYKENFNEYLVYLRKSIEILCTNYGKVGGFWFDGMWDKPNDDWQEDELYGTIRKYQPDAMIINNTGLGFQGKVGHKELDSVTFERGKPADVDNSDRPRAGEMCQIMNNNWGYSKTDVSYRGVKDLIVDLTECRKFGCNYLLNVGPQGDGALCNIEKGILEEMGKWVKVYGESIYDVKPSDITVKPEEDFILSGKGCDYLFVHNLEMLADKNLNIVKRSHKRVEFACDREIESIKWLDNGENLPFENKGNKYSFLATNFPYGTNYVVRVAAIEYKQ